MTPLAYWWAPVVGTVVLFLVALRFEHDPLLKTGHGHIVAFQLLFVVILPFFAMWAVYLLWLLIWWLT
jgi:hypothetical protein